MTYPTIIGLWSPAPGCGKSTVAQLLRERHGHIRLAFADPMKWMLVRLLQSAGYSDNEARRIPWHDKETPLDRLPGAPTMRHLLRTLGTKWAATTYTRSCGSRCGGSRRYGCRVWWRTTCGCRPRRP
jgi:hypothetical protein